MVIFFGNFWIKAEISLSFPKKSKKKQTVVRQLSSCINEKYNGFHIISIEYSDKLRKKSRPINIIYKPAKPIDENILCYYSADLSKAYL